MVTTRFTASDMDAFFRPFTIGFDRVFDNLHTVKDIASNYPPYNIIRKDEDTYSCLLYTSPSPRDATLSRMPSSA